MITADKEKTVSGYSYSGKGIISEETSLPARLTERLPDAGAVEIISFSNAGEAVGTRYSIKGCPGWYSQDGHDYVQYAPKRLSGVSCDAERARALEVFAASYHPFVRSHTSDVFGFAETLFQFEQYLPYFYEVTDQELEAVIPLGYHDTNYRETSGYIRFHDSYTDSFHDGGGSGEREWYVYAAQITECKAETTKEIGYKTFPGLSPVIHLPYCRGCWSENGHVYLVDPWGLPGIFEYYYHEKEKSDYDSETAIWDIGTPCSI